ncbi:MAG: hypothetical protein A3F31_04415 [Candidatus Levybacteria bacterium RIFCSPHIGHO2_12_FULL_38_12]|nr:MAG: hypothetical protein A2770_04915 [Candidatus Levybacteria bacterium RIFCSPHIGHO2_01_FULL_38_12]OGH22397.1 MAG: hypothetical protein A3D75_02485 [Candidatus Levybacteria bacterium RIFCSPHIGHO2_02_FULL_37_18]OGH23233.1 MAG: hypothetical protein A3F31_04415 [Candidatus Levybacteria bacterium RIFCSPHIGHO2_12_FULL_38_12]OGH34692.1 MAG: hypothetical protein A3A47_04765 [Candidatus Levybacteria bacterium RIFCSPLOWO2_01_FULL_37_20]OGH43450.1 MAG: hypothetical protein A3J14_03285 [Candidatus Lev
MFAPILPLIFSSIFSLNMLGLADKPLANVSISLANRYPDSYINTIFKDNILLNLAYLQRKVKNNQIDWNEVKKPFEYSFELRPGQAFAFHEDVLPEFKGSEITTTGAHFSFADGFKTDGYLFGDGVCHLASLLYKAAVLADLQAIAPTNHDFREIPEIEREYGVSIFYNPGNYEVNARQNLYITNDKKSPIIFNIEYKENALKVWITQRNRFEGLDLYEPGRL